MPLLSVASGTHPGQVRQANEDCIFTWTRAPKEGKPLALLIVADGMGGHQAGEVASQLTTETIQQDLEGPLQAGELDTKTTAQLEDLLRHAVEHANDVINQYAKDNPDEAGNLGSTVTCALISGEILVVANVGDSRTYLWHDQELKQLTQDHSYVAQLVRDGQLNPDAVYTHPHRSVIMRALGHEVTVEVDIWAHSFVAGDRLLLCSDGLWELVRNPKIVERFVSSTQPESLVRALINDANQEGGYDNISVIVAELRDNGQVS